MEKSELKITEESIKTELESYKDKPYKCLFEYLWNSFDAEATEVKIEFPIPENVLECVKDLKITDNGKGWDFDNQLITNNFMSSTKKTNKNKTLPKGQSGRGRYAFIWIADKIEIFSKNKKLILQHSTEIKKEKVDFSVQGTEIKFLEINEDLSKALKSKESLYKEILLEFGCFLAENENYKIFLNNEKIDINHNIKKNKILKKDDFEEKIKSELNDNFEVNIILWKEQPSDYSKFYFLNEKNREVFTENTKLNKKRDNFWHAVYIKSSLFESDPNLNEEIIDQQILDFEDKSIQKIKQQILEKIKKELVKLRKSYLIKQSDALLKELKQEKLIPNLSYFDIYDEASYENLLKTVYIITPSLFARKNKEEKKFICSTFAGLLSTQDNILIKKIIEQIQDLTEEEKKDLLDILNRSSLSNVLKTIKEIDHRLEVLDKLKILISKKETLEVKHLQKILDENFWIFGEQFRLFSTTEGPLKKVILKYAQEILKIEEPELQTQSRGELDLFLTKSENYSNIQKNIIVELKRPSITLKEKKEYQQIKDYTDSILEESLCNGENQYWEFYLIGNDYDKGIKNLIENAKQHGEKERGLVFNIKEGKVKIYVRKWSDILEVEWGAKMKYLKDKLKIQQKETKNNTPDEITDTITNQT